MRRIAAVTCLLLPACWGGEAAIVPATRALPTLVPTAVAADLEAVGGTATGVVVGPRGEILTRPVPGGTAVLSLHRPGLGWQGIGRAGSGPGEMQMALALAVDDSSVMAWDLASQQLGRWSLDGAWLGGVNTAGAISPYAVVPGRGVVGTVERSSGTIPVLLDAADGAVRDLLPTLDTAYRRIFPRVAGLAQRFGNPAVVGTWRDGFLLGNGFSYQLVAYDWSGTARFTFGRTLPTNRYSEAQIARRVQRLRDSPFTRSEEMIATARRRMASDSVRWFSHLSPPTADTRGRIWVVGTAGDTAFADLFAESQFLGRLVLDCPGFEGRWGLNGNWLAVICEADDDRDAEVKLFEISDAIQ